MPDPTSREERRRQARPGYDQNSRWNYGEPAAPVKIPSKWDKVPGEWAASVGTALSQPDTGTGPSFFKDVADVGRKVAGAIPRPATTPGEENVRVQEHFRPSAGSAIQPNFNRYREMAGLPPEQAPPVQTAKAVPEPGLMAPGRPTADRESEVNRVYRQPEAVADGEGGPVRETTRGSVGVATRGAGQIPRSPQDQQVWNSKSNDALQRYREMAGMSLEQRNAMLDAMPEGQRPIQTIRGNTEGWYNPALSKEFSGLPQALTGVEGQPTLQSENKREQEARDRMMHQDIAAGRNATAVQIKGMGEAATTARHTAEGKGKGHEWKVEEFEIPDANGTVSKKKMFWNPSDPTQHFEMTPGAAPAIAGVIVSDMAKDEKSTAKWANTVLSFDPEMRRSTLEKFPQKERNLIRAELEKIVAEQKKNKK